MKYCPQCKKRFPDSDAFCHFDGNALLSAENAPAKKNRARNVLIGIFGLFLAVLIVLNLAPYALRSVASNCLVEIQGMSIDKTSNIVGNFGKIVDDIAGALAQGKPPDLVGLDVVLNMSVDNRNFFPLSVRKIHVELFVNDNLAAKGSLAPHEVLELKARAATVIELPLKISMKKAPTIIGSEKFQCRAEGAVLFETMVGDIEHPIRIDGLRLPIQRHRACAREVEFRQMRREIIWN